MTTTQREADSTTTSPPQLVANYKKAKPQKESPSHGSSAVVVVPPLVDTVFAISGEQRKVIVNVSRIKASLEALEKNRRLQKMGLG